MTDVRGIIILEGADASGKTTLARELVAKHGARYLHLRVHKKMWKHHLAAVRLAVKWAQKGLVVIDRLWLSEQVYGQVFRGGPAYDLGARSLDRVLQRHGALTVLCVREDQQKHLRHFEEMKGQRPENFDDIKQVVRNYADLARGDLTRPGDAYVDHLIKYGDFAQRPDVLLYDMDRCTPTQAAGLSIGRLRGLFRHRPGGLFRDFTKPNLVGGIQRPEFLFVGEALSPRAGTPWPFTWSDELSATTWLNRALHHLRFDETRALWTNISDNEWVKDVWELYPGIKLIALGGAASSGLLEMGFLPTEIKNVAYPQWHRRFRAQGGTPEYANLLKEAMR